MDASVEKTYFLTKTKVKYNNKRYVTKPLVGMFFAPKGMAHDKIKKEIEDFLLPQLIPIAARNGVVVTLETTLKRLPIDYTVKATKLQN